jgi:beta-N-acetylhexosaminidase
MKTKALITLPRLSIILSICVLINACSSNNSNTIQQQADQIVSGMSLREKVAQKLMMDVRYWCVDETPNCKTAMTQLPDIVASTLRTNAIGGVILFSDNLKTLSQSQQLVQQIQQIADPQNPIGLFIGIDQEGGNVFRFPRTEATSFSGNMALGAAYAGNNDDTLAYDFGSVIASELRTIGLNVNFAPVVDVNSNPKNPVINVRAYGDDPSAIYQLARRSAQGMRAQGVISTFKHFPGHGDTDVDSHYGLPVVYKTREQAYAIDLAPYRYAIEAQQEPDMIMTAHIQYPALDNSLITTRTGEQLITPATMSRSIQYELLRNEMGYRGITISDALDMKAISDLFDPTDAVIKVFQAGVDIALMPVKLHSESDINKLNLLIDNVVAAINSGQINANEVDLSVKRIVEKKLFYGITPIQTPSSSDLSTIGSPAHRAVENQLARHSITLLHNANATLPLNANNKSIFIMTPWAEQAEAMRRRFVELGYSRITGAKLDNLSWEAQQQAIDSADIVILGTLSTALTPAETGGLTTNFISPTPFLAGSLVANVAEDELNTLSIFSTPLSESQRMRKAMAYAKSRQKTVIHVSMRAPYDVVNYDDLADASLATYSYYGYENGLRGPSLPVLVDTLLGLNNPLGKLPVNLPVLNSDDSIGTLRYARGFGLSYDKIH